MYWSGTEEVDACYMTVIATRKKWVYPLTGYGMEGSSF